jgi:hypothetical protein
VREVFFSLSNFLFGFVLLRLLRLDAAAVGSAPRRGWGRWFSTLGLLIASLFYNFCSE